MSRKKFQDFVSRQVAEFGKCPSPYGFVYGVSSAMSFGIPALGLKRVEDRKELRSKHDDIAGRSSRGRI